MIEIECVCVWEGGTGMRTGGGSEWMNEWVNEWVCVRVSVWMSECVNVGIGFVTYQWSLFNVFGCIYVDKLYKYVLKVGLGTKRENVFLK